MTTILLPPQISEAEPASPSAKSEPAPMQPPVPTLVSAADALGMLTHGATPVTPVFNACEMVLIGLMVKYEATKWVLEELTPEHFGLLTPEKRIFEIILAVEKSGHQVGIHTVLDRCPNEGPTSKAWASKSFDEWRIEYDKGEDLRSALDAIKNRHSINRVNALLRKGMNDLATRGKEPNTVAAELANALDGLTASTHIPTVSQLELNEETLRSLISHPTPAFSTGFPELDRRIGGLSPSRIYIVAARTGQGKTAFLLNLLCTLGRQNIPTGFISLEMDRVTMNKRLYGIAGQLEASQFSHPVSEGTLDVIRRTIAETNQWSTHWSDRRGMTLSDLKSKLSQFARQGCRVAFVDYLQRVVVQGNEARHLQVAQIAKTLADLAERLDMAIVAASQINREGAKSRTSPELHNIAESTVIEESSDVVILLNNKEKEDVTYGRNRAVTLNVAKNRHGFGGCVNMYYCGRQFRFSEQPFIIPPPPAPRCPAPIVPLSQLPPVPTVSV